MKTRHICLLAVMLVACALGVYLKTRTHRLQANLPPLAPIAVQEKSVSASGTGTSDIPSTPAGEGAVTESAGTSNQTSAGQKVAVKFVTVRPDQAVARVNGATITLKDLIPITAADAAEVKTMSPEMFQALVQRAIDREVAFQAAQKQGIKLSETEQQQLQQLKDSKAHPYPGYRMIQPAGVDPASLDFEARDAQGLILQNDLAAAAGLPSPYPTDAQVQQYYKEHQAELPTDPQERDRVIRNRLEPELQAAYKKALADYIEKLRAEANVQVAQMQ